ncbi:MAG: ABC transporter ATP-binding protein [Phycisphaerales bacterium]|jgi:ABC-2 type transport system ATP-binding protein|nr:ABC transporter ATP-binding protein [Phycisphaerales bacterium]
MSNLAISLNDLDKTYRGRVHALRGVSMDVHRGEVFGLLGPNGAGKSTLVKILMTVVRPSKGRGTLLGEPIGSKPALAKVGYLPEHHRFPDYLTGEQTIDFFGGLSAVPRRVRRERIPKLLELVGMSDWAGKRVKTYSKGMRQRLGIAQALVNDPALVLLDEPTDGVDPVGRRDIRDIVRRLAGEGRTVLLNSHLLSELEVVCDRVAIMVQGKVVRQGTMADLTEPEKRYEIELTAPLPEAALGELRDAAPDAHPVELSGAMITAGTTDPDSIQPLIAILMRKGAVVKSVRSHRPSLEDLFMRAVTDPETGRTLAPGAARENTRGKGGR